MIMPRHMQNGRELAQSGKADGFLVVGQSSHGMIINMEPDFVRAGSCNSVFRYPSPFGWFCGVPAGSPVFYARGATSRTAGLLRRKTRAGTKATCQTNLLSALPWRHSSACQPVATHLANRPLSAPVLAQRRRRWYPATCWQARSSAARPMWFTAKNSPTNADLMSLAALQPDPKHKPSMRSRASMAFLLPMRMA